jgi:ComF family protein
MLAQAGRRLGALLFGGSCFLCRGAARELLCAPCDAELPRLGAALCPRCALASPSGALCGRCLADPPRYDATLAALEYRFPADVLVQALKFRSELALAPLLAGFLLGRSPERVDLLIPVPLSGRRLRERGFNQALEIARHLAGATGARLEPTLCERTRETAAQMDLPLAERRKNVAGAFRCERLLAGATIAIVDDVMTTGATLDELAATLKRAGAERVVNWVVARTPPPA